MNPSKFTISTRWPLTCLDLQDLLAEITTNQISDSRGGAWIFLPWADSLLCSSTDLDLWPTRSVFHSYPRQGDLDHLLQAEKKADKVRFGYQESGSNTIFAHDLVYTSQCSLLGNVNRSRTIGLSASLRPPSTSRPTAPACRTTTSLRCRRSPIGRDSTLPSSRPETPAYSVNHTIMWPTRPNTRTRKRNRARQLPVITLLTSRT